MAQNIQMKNFDEQESMIYNEIDEINKRYDLLKQSRSYSGSSQLNVSKNDSNFEQDLNNNSIQIGDAKAIEACADMKSD